MRDCIRFFLQAEDGIRVRLVTGVQTCALPILLRSEIINTSVPLWDLMMKNIYSLGAYQMSKDGFRSEERRVGKECRSRWSPYH